MYNIRAKIIKGSACKLQKLEIRNWKPVLSKSASQPFLTLVSVLVCPVSGLLEVRCSRKIAAGFQGILDSRAKVGVGSVMLVGSRKIVYRYAGICIGCSVDHHGLYSFSRLYNIFTAVPVFESLLLRLRAYNNTNSTHLKGDMCNESTADSRTYYSWKDVAVEI